jgi:hypothetical protein
MYVFFIILTINSDCFWNSIHSLASVRETQCLLNLDANILGGSVHTIKKNAEALVVASKETGLEINDKTKYMVMSKDQNAWGSHNIKTDNSAFEKGGRVQIFGNNLNKSKFYSGEN